MYKLLLVLVSFLIVSTVMAEEKIQMEEVVVTASKIEEPIEESTTNVTVIKGSEIEKMNVEFVTDVLRKVPELNVVQKGGVGENTSIYLRGGDTKHTLVLIDGVKMNDANSGGFFNLSGINVDEIERIEIVKGPQSTIYGSEAMAGVINIITKKGKGAPKVQASFEGGSYDTFNPSMTVSGSHGKVNYRITGYYLKTDGISAAKEGEERDGYKNASISGKFGFVPTEKFEVELTGKYYSDRSELDGFDFITGEAVDDLNYVKHGNNLVLSATGKLYLMDMWEQLLTVSRVFESIKGRDPDPEDIFNNFTITSDKNIVDWQHNVYLSDYYLITAGAEYRKEKGENEGTYEESIINRALYVNNKLKLLEDALIFNAGLRYDDHETFGHETTYRVGVSYKFKPASLRIKSSYGTGFRSPSFVELFFPGFGNPELRPEESRSWEVGLEKGFFNDRMNVSLTYFDQEYEDLIQFSFDTFLPENIAEAAIRGIETTARFKVTDSINVSAGYTYLDTEDRATGERLTLKPKDKITISAEFLTEKISLTSYYTFVGERIDSSVNRHLSSYSLFNIAGSYKIGQQLTVFARIDNLFDTDYEESGGFGTLGFSAFTGVKLEI